LKKWLILTIVRFFEKRRTGNIKVNEHLGCKKFSFSSVCAHKELTQQTHP